MIMKRYVVPFRVLLFKVETAEGSRFLERRSVKSIRDKDIRRNFVLPSNSSSVPRNPK